MAQLRKKTHTKLKSSSAPVHSHTGFIIAMIVAVMLLISLTAIAYLSWNGNTTLEKDISQLNEKVEVLETANVELTNEKEDYQDNQYFYTKRVENGTQTWSIDNLGNEELVHDGSGSSIQYEIYAQPRIGYDSRIFIRPIVEGDNPILFLRILNTKTGVLDDLDPSIELPNIWATVLSRSERLIAAIYDNPNYNFNSRELRILDLVDGRSSIVGTLDESERFVESDTGLGGSYGEHIVWVSDKCVSATIYTNVPSGDNIYKEQREFCL